MILAVDEPEPLLPQVSHKFPLVKFHCHHSLLAVAISNGIDTYPGRIARMDDPEISTASAIYQGGLTLTETRAELVRLGYPSRSVNTIRARLIEHGLQLRRPGRRRSE